MRRTWIALLVSCWVCSARADEASLRQVPAPMHYAIGVSTALELRRDYGDDTRAMYAPELLGQGYLRLPPARLYLRPGLRVGYDGITQAEQPRDVRVVERGFHALAEAALLYDWVVVPAFSLGAGTSTRFISAHTRGPVHGGGALDRSETLLMLVAQLGFGIPIARGRILVEPYARFQGVLRDTRAWARFGFDLSIGF